MSSVDAPVSPRRSLAGILAAIVFGIALLIAIAEIGLRILMPHWADFDSWRFMRTIQVPGWGSVVKGVPEFDGWFAQNNGDFRAHIRLNAAGLRNPDPLSAANDRVWVIGDSMTFGWGVAQDAMYSSIIAAKSHRPTYNVASPGTNVCGYQALAALMPKGMKPSAVVVGLVLENDVVEYDCPHGKGEQAPPPDTGPVAAPSLMDAKHFLTAHSALYNFLAVSLKRIPAISAALESLGIIKPVQHYRLAVSRDRMQSAVERTADELAFLKGMFPKGTPFAVLIVPARFEIRDGDPAYTTMDRSMHTALKKRGVTFIDVFPAFRAAGFKPTHFAHDGHWSPLGHRIAGEAVAAWLNTALPAQ